MDDNERLIINQRNNDGVEYSSGSINMEHEITSGYIVNVETGEVIRDLTVEEVLAILDGDTKITYRTEMYRELEGAAYVVSSLGQIMSGVMSYEEAEELCRKLNKEAK